MSVAPEARDLLLELTAGPQSDVAARVGRIDPAGWAAIAAIAREHRLAPLLAHRLAEGDFAAAVPAELRAAWSGALLVCTRRWLRQLRILHEVSSRLDAAGLRHAALKGAWLAYAAYPGGGARPMRDLDILVDDVPAADRILREAGFAPPPHIGEADRKPEEDENHVATLLAPDGGEMIELHHRIDALWRGPGGLDETRLLDAAQVVDTPQGPLRFPDPEDVLLHLVGHGALHHRFDNGPLLLSDVALLCRAAPIDWPRYVRRAEAAGLARASDLVFALLRELRGAAVAGGPPAPGGEVPAAIRTRAKDLLVIGRAEAWARLVAVDAALQAGARGRAAHVLGRAAPKRSALAQMASRPEHDWRIWLQAPAWYADRGRRFLATQLDRSRRAAIGGDVGIDRWLRGD